MRKLLIALTIVANSTLYGSNFNGGSEGDRFGLGINFSGIPGVSLYADTSIKNFVQAAIGFADNGSFEATGDYAFPFRNAMSRAPLLTPFFGVGILVLHDQNDYWSKYSKVYRTSTTYWGARIPFGLNCIIPETPIQLSAELAPSLLLTPSSYAFLQGAFSVRILF